MKQVVTVQGTYVWINPTSVSAFDIRMLAGNAPFEVVSANELHCTLMYSTDVQNYRHLLDSLSNSIIRANIVDCVEWLDNNESSYIVLLLDSQPLLNLHSKWSNLGLTHSYPKFTPHISIGAKIIPSKTVASYVAQLSKRIKEFPITITLQNEGLDFLKS